MLSISLFLPLPFPFLSLIYPRTPLIAILCLAFSFSLLSWFFMHMHYCFHPGPGPDPLLLTPLFLVGFSFSFPFCGPCSMYIKTMLALTCNMLLVKYILLDLSNTAWATKTFLLHRSGASWKSRTTHSWSNPRVADAASCNRTQPKHNRRTPSSPPQVRNTLLAPWMRDSFTTLRRNWYDYNNLSTPGGWEEDIWIISVHLFPSHLIPLQHTPPQIISPSRYLSPFSPFSFLSHTTNPSPNNMPVLFCT